MWLKEMFVFFLSLALGYILCVVARKQVSVLKTVGYTLGIAIMILTFTYALIAAHTTAPLMKHKYGMCDKMHGMKMVKHR